MVPQKAKNQHVNLWMYIILVLLLIALIVLGCLMDSLSMILLAIPFFWPVISSLDFGMGEEDLKIWFGILALIVVELGLITPPVGMNVFIISPSPKQILLAGFQFDLHDICLAVRKDCVNLILEIHCPPDRGDDVDIADRVGQAQALAVLEVLPHLLVLVSHHHL